jgi:hypothetical protein
LRGQPENIRHFGVCYRIRRLIASVTH